MKTVIKLYGVLFLIGLILFACSCSKPRYGCTKREVKYVQKHFPKLVNKCNAETIRQSLIYYPLVESDSTWSEYKKGVDTFWRMSEPIVYDCDEFIRQRDSMAKLGLKTKKKASVKCPDCPYTIDEINHYKQTIKEDGRRVGILENELSIAAQKEADMAVELSEKNVEIAKEKTAKRIWRNLFIALSTLFAVIIGVKFIIPKVLNRL